MERYDAGGAPAASRSEASRSSPGGFLLASCLGERNKGQGDMRARRLELLRLLEGGASDGEQSTGGLHEAVNALVDVFGPPGSEHAASYSPELADGLYVSAAGGLPLMEKGGDGRGTRRKRSKGGATGGTAREKSAGARRKTSSASAQRHRQ